MNTPPVLRSDTRGRDAVSWLVAMPPKCRSTRRRVRPCDFLAFQCGSSQINLAPLPYRMHRGSGILQSDVSFVFEARKRHPPGDKCVSLAILSLVN